MSKVTAWFKRTFIQEPQFKVTFVGMVREGLYKEPAATLSLLAGTVACFLPLLTYNRNVRLAKERQDALKRY
ncbi:Uncharacterized protein PBTT_05396 [Plasmodiophora brassicae]|uniref:Uncharacterized protein n=1 Tax=Plasmodiophora brassicae TaxID=37360 RepID=A0A0G4IQH4_PLABS|nr:hypothetical protein PBRA_000822 [Plasmodiophora brassicae]SPQ97788.1 unnamed protein product [Plasmodiophora brassicae]